MSAWSVSAVFGDEMEGHVCCSCCDGYCTLNDAAPSPGPEALVKLDGGAYVSDRYAAIRGDLVEIPKGRIAIDGPKIPADWQVPGERPPLSAGLFQPSRVARLWALGVSIHDGGEGMIRQHLYLGDEHIGWLMPGREGETLEAIAELQRILDGIPESAISTHPKAKAAALIHDLGGPRIDALWMIRQAAAEVAR